MINRDPYSGQRLVFAGQPKRTNMLDELALKPNNKRQKTESLDSPLFDNEDSVALKKIQEVVLYLNQLKEHTQGKVSDNQKKDSDKKKLKSVLISLKKKIN